MQIIKSWLLIFFVLFLPKAYCQLPFVMDSTFGINGIARPLTHSSLSIPTAAIWIHEMLGSALQPDGKIVIAGTANFHMAIEVVRLNTDGSLDTTFNHIGFSEYTPNASGTWKFKDIKITPSGKILLGYISENPLNDRSTLLCILPNGSLDGSFGTAGKIDVGMALTGQLTWLYAMDVQTDGKIIMGCLGTSSFTNQKYILTRIKSNGTPDTSFGVNGIAECPYYFSETRNVIINAIAVQKDGKLIGTGVMPADATHMDTMFMIRYKANGTPDSAYGVNGMIKLSGTFTPGAVSVDSANYAYVMGVSAPYIYNDTFYIMKFSPAGPLASSFGTGGKITINTRLAIMNGHEQLIYTGRLALQHDGKMLVAGNSDTSATSAFRLCRLLTTGQMDTTFAPNGTITVFRGKRDYCSNFLAQEGGKITLTGFYRTGEGIFDTARVLAMRFWDRIAPVDTSDSTVTTGVEKYNHFASRVYPNPIISGNDLKIEFDNMVEYRTIKYSLTDITGQQKNQGTLSLKQGHTSASIPLQHSLAKGPYFLRLHDDQGVTQVHKIFIGE